MGHDEAGVWFFGSGGDEARLAAPSSEKILNSVCGDPWRCAASCDGRGDCGVHSPED